jgi:hypothetical protein
MKKKKPENCTPADQKPPLKILSKEEAIKMGKEEPAHIRINKLYKLSGIK